MKHIVLLVWLSLISLFEIPTALAQSAVGALQTTNNEAEVKQKLERIRVQMQQTQLVQLATQDLRGGLLTELRTQELKVADLVKALRLLEQSLAVKKRELSSLQASQKFLQGKLDTQRDALAALLRSAYAIGRHHGLQVLFAREKISDTQRLLAYHGYVERDRSARIGAIQQDQIQLNRIAQDILQTQSKMQAEAVEKREQTVALANERSRRESTLQSLNQQLLTQAQQLKQMQLDERELLALLERLQNAIADVPTHIATDVPFASRQGRLPWPARGPIKAGFGVRLSDGRNSEGWLIAAAPGSSVHAIARGRVAFADWLNGYGLLVILDHGDGFMSLYARTESILVEVGSWVESGETLATATQINNLGGSHTGGLYFELRRNSQPVNPVSWLTR